MRSSFCLTAIDGPTAVGPFTRGSTFTRNSVPRTKDVAVGEEILLVDLERSGVFVRHDRHVVLARGDGRSLNLFQESQF